MILRVQWLLPLFVSFCAAWMDDRPVLESQIGDLFITSARDKNITLKTLGNGYVNLNDINLLHIALMAQNASQLVERWRKGFLAEMENTLQRLKGAVEGPSGLQRRISILEWATANKTGLNPGINNNFRRSTIDDFARTRIRSLTTRVRTLEVTVRNLQAKLTANQCSSNPCQNGGTCEDVYDGFKCLCPDNWEGTLCSTDVNECARFAGTDLGCQNGATCINQFGSYQCACPSGWFGIHCTKRTNDCNLQSSSELCGHGVCVNTAGSTPGYKCICDRGWETDGTSPACIKDVDECATKHLACSVNPMVPCINVEGSYHCGGCPAGYTGDGYYCADIDECSTNNGGCSTTPTVECINTMGSRRCGSCPPGYLGDGVTCSYVGSCRINNGGCHPQARCFDNSAASVQCLCPSGYVGNGMGPQGCLLDVNHGVSRSACSSNPCIHGTCIPNGASAFTCSCSLGFTGTTCNKRVNPCDPNPCKNQGTCSVVTALGNRRKAHCHCTASFSGPICATQRESCGGILRDPDGILQFPNTGSTYQPGLSCAWVLMTNHSLVINVTFTAFHLENSTRCQYDFLQVHDGSTAGDHMKDRFCGSTLPNNGSIISSHNALYLWFHSDHSVSGEGFTLEWNSIQPVCGGRIEADHGVISSPGSPGPYPPNRDCYWTIAVPYGKRIQFHFFAVMLEEHPTCGNDYLEITDGSQEDSGQQIGLYCNHSHPAPLLSLGPVATLHFHSDSFGQDAGFQITFSSVEGMPGCGGVYTDVTGDITTPDHPNKYRANLDCEWKIQLPIGERIRVTWISFDLEHSVGCRLDSVEIYNGPNSDAPVIGRYCESLPPSIQMSDSNVLLVRFRSDWSIGGDGFRLHYEALCGGQFTEETGVLKSPYYPNPYPASRTCVYEIIQPPGRSISFTFEDMEIENSFYSNCAFDFLSIYDGDGETSPLIGTYCGTNDTMPTDPIYSTHNHMYLKFETDSSVHNRGFKATYSTLDERCGGILKSATGVLQTPGNGGTYSNNEDCTWIIQAPPGFVIQITWQTFSLEFQTSCLLDFVKVFEVAESHENLMGRYCGTKKPPVLVTQGRTMKILFHTDSSITRDGFMATYAFIDASKTCGGHFYSLNGYISSPNHPKNYPNSRECVWIIEAPNRHQVKLNIDSFEIEVSTNCRFDFLEIRNGGSETSPLIGKYCEEIPREFTSLGNQIYLKFQSDTSFSRPGFNITWDSTTIGCGGTLTSANGDITSPNYPQPYGTLADCNWKIAVAAGSRIQFIIVDLDLEEHDWCAFDYIEFIDGPESRGKKLGSYCTTAHPAVINTNTNIARIRFRSDFTNSGRGFHIKYETLCNNTLHGLGGVIESPNFPNKYPHSLNCSWLIEVPTGNKVNLTFSHFDMERGWETVNTCTFDYLEVKEGDNNRPSKEIGKYCNSGSLPPMIASSQNQVFLHFVTDRSYNEKGFRLEWVINGCGGHLTRPQGTITSPLYPNRYPKNLDCQWLIEVETMQSVEITVLDMDMERMVDCAFDKISLYAGEDETAPKLLDLCYLDHNKQMTYTSSGNKMFLTFHSDFSTPGRGFRAQYKTVDLLCGGKFSTATGIINSANYPLNYPNNQNCEWRIEVDKNHVVNLTFIDFDIEDSRNCTDDYVRLYDGPTRDAPVLGSHCHNKLPPSYVSSSNELLVVMRTDNYVSAKGFKAAYGLACGARIVTSDQGIIELSAAVLMQNSFSNCSWIIAAENLADHVTLTFTHMDVQSIGYTDGCVYNYIEVYEGEGAEGPPLGSWCGKKVPPSITSQGNALTLHFVNLYGGYGRVDEFTATYSVLNSACGGNYTSEHGTIASPGYPNSYPLNAECVWVLNTSPGNRIQLNFQEFELEETENCDLDYVEVRLNDGLGKLLDVSCGKNISSFTTYANLWIKFRSSEEGTAKGFKAEYSLLHGGDLTGPVGQIASPMYPKPYMQEGDFQWRVTVDYGSSIQISFKEFHLESEECYSSRINIYDGYDNNAPVLLNACGVDLPGEIRSSSNVVFIHLEIESDWRLGNWFLLEWLQIPRVLPSGPIDLKGCNELVSLADLNNSSYTFSSPGWPEGYKPNLDCTWIIESPPGTHLSLRFDTLEVEDSPNCNLDYVIVASGNPLSSSREWTSVGQYCMPNSTTTRIPTSNLMKVQFLSDEFVNGTGFQATVYKECGGVLSGPNGVIGFNATTIARQIRTWKAECVWTVNVRPGRTIEVKVDNIDIAVSELGTCGNNYLMLKNGGSASSPLLGVGKYCGTRIPDPLMTTGNQLYIKATGLRPTAQFNLTYREVGMNCGENFILSKDQSTLDINSPNYPNIPQPHSECFWTIMAPAGELISIHFVGRFDLTASPSCDQEYVEIRDGGTEFATSLGRYCTGTAPSSLTTKGNMMYIHFYTDVPDPKNGFHAIVTTGEECGGIIRGNRGVVKSPNYPEQYPNNSTCAWLIIGPPHHTLNLQFKDIHLPRVRECTNRDSVTISERVPINDTMRELGVYCGSDLPGIIKTSGNKAIIEFKSTTRRYASFRGFALNFTASRERCGGQLTGMGGEFESPGYPASGLRPRYCGWNIAVPDGYQVVVDMLDQDIGDPASLTSGQFIQFFHDQQHRSRIRYNATTESRVSSSGNKMSIWYYSISGSHKGFKARYSAVAPAPCGGHRTDLSGVLLPPQGPSFNGSNTFHCEWKLGPIHAGTENVSTHTLLLKISGTIGNASGRSRSCPYYASGIVVAGFTDNKMQIDRVCGNLTETVIVRSPSPVNKIMAAKIRNPMNFTIQYQWQRCGGILGGPSHTIESPTGLDYPLDCAWFVNFPDNGETIRMRFESLNLIGSCDESYILVRNGGPSSPKVGTFCGNIKPDDIIPQSNELWIEYHSEKPPSSFKFTLETVSGGCGGHLHGNSKDISSPGFPKRYPNNAECVWEITVASGYHIGLNFIDRFNLETSTNCTKDYVQVFEWLEYPAPGQDNWKEIRKVCGRDAPPPINSTSNRMKVIFRSNDEKQGDGFHARWDLNCGGTLAVTKDTRYLRSPGYPHDYGRDLFCNYTFIAPKEKFIVEFTDFEVEPGGLHPDCIYDNVTIQNVPRDGFSGEWDDMLVYATSSRTPVAFCGTNLPPIQRGRGQMELHFMTDAYVQKRGFELKYHLDYCGGEMREPGEILSPVNSDSYYGRTNCTWVITAPPGKSVVLRFEKFELRGSVSCFFDGLEIFEGPVIDESKRMALLCGNLTSSLSAIRTENNTMTVSYQNEFTRVSSGFKAMVSFTNGPALGCGGEVNVNDTVAFKTQKGSLYEPLLDCHWTIRTLANNAIRLTITSVDLKNSTTSRSTNKTGPCTGDYLEIRDGAGPLSELIGQYCGNIIPPSIVSSTNALWIRLVTDGTINGAGVTAILKAIHDPCGVLTLEAGDTSQVITSPGFPMPYEPGLRCRWTVKQQYASRNSRRVFIRFLQFDLEDSDGCSGDKLEISNQLSRNYISEGFGSSFVFSGAIVSHYEGDSHVSTYTYCGNKLPHDYYSTESDIEISFKTSPNKRTTHKGFKLDYARSSCNRNYTSTQGRIIQEHYKDCLFTITVPANQTISLYFNELISFTMNRECSTDDLQVWNGDNKGEPVATLCGTQLPSPIFSTGNKLTIHAKSSNRMNYSMYDITYTATDKGRGCGGKLYNYGGRFTSPMYPVPYRNDTVCTWDVSVPVGLKVTLIFHVFDIGSRATCETDHLEVINSDGSVTNYCGEDNPADFHSIDNSVSVRYTSSVNNGGTGWIIKFTAFNPKRGDTSNQSPYHIFYS